MSLLTENIIPGSLGKVFGTNAKEPHDLERIKNKVLELEGIKDVNIDLEVFPREFTVHTSKVMHVDEIEKKALATGFHAIPKDFFEH